ncbi:hypothetical protein ES708_34270 [subsurface metagenome]
MKFEIYDGTETRLLVNNDCIVEAGTARKALQKYLNSKGMGHIKFENTAGNDVTWKTTPFIERDGVKYRCGRISWWGIKPTKI